MSNPTELPDLEVLMKDLSMGWGRERRLRTMQAIRDLFARRAKPEGEAPQGEPAMWVQYIDGVKTQNVARDAKEKASVESIHRVMAPGTTMTWRALYDHAPPAQHAERGAPVAKAAQALLDCCDGLPIDTDEATTAALTAFDRTRAALRKALAAQSQGAQAAGCDQCEDGYIYDTSHTRREKCRHCAAISAKAEAPAPEWGRVRTVADMVRNLLTLDQADPIHAAFPIEFQGKRRMRTSPITISRERVIDGKWVDQTRKDVPYATVVWAKPDERAQQAAAPGTLAADELTRLLRLMRALGDDDAFEQPVEYVRGVLATVLGQACRRIESFARPSAPGTPEAPAWRAVTGPGQVEVGARLRFKIGDKHFHERAKLILHAGTDKEEVIYDKGRNFYFITSCVMSGFSNHKNVEFTPPNRAAQLDDGQGEGKAHG